MYTTKVLLLHSELKLTERLHKGHPFNITDGTTKLEAVSWGFSTQKKKKKKKKKYTYFNNAALWLFVVPINGNLSNSLNPFLDRIRDVRDDYNKAMQAYRVVDRKKALDIPCTVLPR
jgi:hypothetical protein